MINLELIKTHCRLDPDFTDDDKLLSIFLRAAHRYIEGRTKRKLFKDVEDEGYTDDGLLMDGDIEAVMLLLVGHWYENRESVNIGNITSIIPFGPDELLQQHRRY